MCRGLEFNNTIILLVLLLKFYHNTLHKWPKCNTGYASSVVFNALAIPTHLSHINIHPLDCGIHTVIVL
ncbi:hypothetical protein NTGM5_680007 [Candidatus Nitrotoga sp. M5]|nr:hypothetical protein NTGM5_680007 [Candidatus Nitrotoga sp. M5]